ncbi:MAG: hypothetical protein M3Y07_06735 [Acidobacteriota bacterium]|nr:hypothetical protein [Acidobacteriota bacterium]
MKKIIFITALLSSTLTLLGVSAMGAKLAKLENARVKVSEMVYGPGVPRERYIRGADQVIVFLDDCRYRRIDSKTKEQTVRERKSGEVIWHNKGEDAPVLINLGSKPYRTIVIELK